MENNLVTKAMDIVNLAVNTDFGVMHVKKNVELDAMDMFVKGPQGYA